ncbi:hypothetical protein KFK09_011371 [Dendrobium nobile]|uniref:Uncharacterized protein n=1 Tax=Dendrobium nobile TaxID=94219 RepID=A0A8T3BCI3_DENNO|nr:hypothetical protein KFK09_011371 [Dendrobium nobile]
MRWKFQRILKNALNISAHSRQLSCSSCELLSALAAFTTRSEKCGKFAVHGGIQCSWIVIRL